MNYHVMTLFPEFIQEASSHSILKRGIENNLITVTPHNIRDFSTNKHKKVDDYPFGGGAGMVMSVDAIVLCHENILINNNLNKDKVHTIYMSPKGKTLTQAKAEELGTYDNLIIICGHYEGIDQRAIDMVVDEEISIGDYILTGGELGAMVVIDSTARLHKGVLNKQQSHEEESFAGNLLEYPQYTRPREFRGQEVPSVLLSGNHKLVDEWRLEKSLEITKERRQDLFAKINTSQYSKQEKKIYEKVLKK